MCDNNNYHYNITSTRVSSVFHHSLALRLDALPDLIIRTRRIRALDRVEHDLRRDQTIHVPDRLVGRARQLRDMAQLHVRRRANAQVRELDGQPDGDQQLEVAVELLRRRVVEDQLAHDAEGD